MSGVLKNIGLVCVSCLAALLIAEAIARSYFVDTVLFNRFHSVVSYGDFVTRRLQPNTSFVHTSRDGVWRFDINGQGFRAGRDYSYENPDHVFRLLIVGDSHTQGMEVGQDETFSHLLDRRSCQGRTLETINAGISGSGTSEHLVFYEAEGRKYAPDAVLLGFFANDFDNNLTGFHSLGDDGAVTISQKTHPATLGTKILQQHNRIGLLSSLSQSSYLYSIAMNYGWKLGKSLVYGHHLEENVFAKKQADAETEKMKISLTHGLLSQFHASVSRNGADFMIADIPQYTRTGAASSLRQAPLPETEEWTNAVIALDGFHPGMFVAHGQRHINAETHARLAERIYQHVCAHRSSRLDKRNG